MPNIILDAKHVAVMDDTHFVLDGDKEFWLNLYKRSRYILSEKIAEIELFDDMSGAEHPIVRLVNERANNTVDKRAIYDSGRVFARTQKIGPEFQDKLYDVMISPDGGLFFHEAIPPNIVVVGP